MIGERIALGTRARKSTHNRRPGDGFLGRQLVFGGAGFQLFERKRLLADETSVPIFARRFGVAAWRSAASAGQSAQYLPTPSHGRPQAPRRYPEPSRVRSPTPLSERLCRREKRRGPCPCKPENHKFSDLWRPK